MKFSLLFISIFFFFFSVSDAQYVTIPDHNFRIFLKSNFPKCFNLDEQMDTTCSGIINQGSIVIANQNISDIDGIQYFDALNTLICTKNNLTYLPKLPDNLKILVCPRNQLKKLPALPSGLNALLCTSNKLNYLPRLPSSITELGCDSNELLSLPELPLELLSLRCTNNELKNLPVLPNKLNTLDASGNCFKRQIVNSNPEVLKSFKVYPNRPDSNIVSYLHKITDNKYLVCYEKPIGIDNGVSLLEYRCGYGFGTIGLTNIDEINRKFIGFEDYKEPNLQRGIIKAHFIKDTVTYFEKRYHLGDTLRIPKLDTVVFKNDNRIIGTNGSTWNGYSNYYLKNEDTSNFDLEGDIGQFFVPRKIVEYEAPEANSYLYFFPRKQILTTTKANTTEQVLADFKLFHKDTTFSFPFVSISCVNYLYSNYPFERRTDFSIPRVDSVILKIQEGKSNLKNIKLVYAIYNGNTSISDRNYIVCDSISSFGSSDVILRHTGPLSGMVMQEGDSMHYQLIAEFDTIQKPFIFRSDNITIRTSIVKAIYYPYPGSLISSDIVKYEFVLNKSLTYCGNIKPWISQTNNVLTSNVAIGNTWYKDGNMLPNETNQTLLISSSGKYKVKIAYNCDSAESNEISVIFTGIEDEYSTDAIQFFPNPMTSELFIEGLQKVYLAEIIDQFGTRIISKSVSEKNAINVAGLTSGMYFLRLFDENKTLKFSSKLLKK
jgi:hypothetical protein